MSHLLAPGIWALRHPRGSSVYVVRASDGTFVLVDAAFNREAKRMIGEIRRIVGSGRLTHVLLSHGHFDHAGAAREIAQAFGAEVVAGAGDCEVVGGHLVLKRQELGRSGAPRGQQKPRRRGGVIQRYIVGPMVERLADYPQVRVDVAIEERVEIAPGIEVIPTPGHSPGSLCFLARHLNAIFVGDLVISHRSGISRAERRDREAYERSLAMIAGEAPAMGFPGHGYPVLRNFDAKLKGLVNAPARPRTGGSWRRKRRVLAFWYYLLRRGIPR